MIISVVIVSYNVKEYIISCIQSIYKHSKGDFSFEIIVVDNNSTDGSVSKLKNEFPDIILINNNYNAGYSTAANQGAKKSQGKYIFFLNPDTLFLENSLAKISKIAEGFNKLGVIGPKLINEEGLAQQSCWKSPTVLNTMLSLLHLDFFNYRKNYKNKKFNKISKVDSVSGGAFFLTRNLFNKLGGFNENLFWMEDIDFCFRAKKMGYDISYFPFTKIIHFVGKSAEKNYKIAISNQMISKIKFFKNHHSPLAGFIILCTVMFVSIIKSTLMLIILPFSDLYRKKTIAYLFTIYSIIKKGRKY